MNKLNPESQFPHSKANIRRILARYDLPLSRYEQATSGIENLTLIVWSDNKKYVLRVYRQNKKSDASILRELDFMSTLKHNGLPVPTVIDASNNELLVISELEGKKWQSVLMHYAPGQHPTAYTLALLEDMAILQAKMHNIGQQYAKTRNIPNTLKILKERLMTDALLTDNTMDEYFQNFLERANSFTVELDGLLPAGMSHFDYDADNLFADNSDHVTAILDFDDAACMPLVVCLGYTLQDIITSSEADADSVARYLQKYQAVRQLTQCEKAVLPQVILFRHYVIIAFRMHFNNLSHADFDRAIQQEQHIQNLKLRYA